MKLLNKIKSFIKKADKDLAVRSVAAALVLFGLFAMVDFKADCDDIRNSVLRLHILANSDSESDQELKLKVRDAVLLKSDEIFSDCKTREEALAAAEKSIELLTACAEKTVNDNGYSYPVSVAVENVWFEPRKYDGFTLPAGEYEALRVIIGNGEGHNWWCVMFPAVCIPAAEKRDKISSVLNESETDIVEHPGKYRARFKIVEYCGRMKSALKKWL